jgi:hypothetical protein
MLEQRRLPDAGGATDHQCSASAVPCPLEQLIQDRTLAAPIEKHGQDARSWMIASQGQGRS